jgi:hypothetical protein
LTLPRWDIVKGFSESLSYLESHREVPNVSEVISLGHSQGILRIPFLSPCEVPNVSEVISLGQFFWLSECCWWQSLFLLLAIAANLPDGCYEEDGADPLPKTQEVAVEEPVEDDGTQW